MTTSSGIRKFSSLGEGGPIRFGDHRIMITPGVGPGEDSPLSAYAAFFAAGEQADLPAPYDEIWVVVQGSTKAGPIGAELVVGAGEFLHVPKRSPGLVVALADTELVCVRPGPRSDPGAS